MIGLTLLLCAAAMGYALFIRFRLPLIPLLVLPGIALSAVGVRPEADFLKMTLELGLAFLVFTSGIELSPNRFAKRGGAVLAISLAQFAVAASAGYGLARLLGEDHLTAVYLGCALSASSTLVVLRHLRVKQQMFEPFGRLVTGVLLLQDLMMIVVIIVLARMQGGAVSVAVGLGWGAGLFALATAIQRWGMPALVRTRLDEESVMLCMIALLFFFVGIARHVGVPTLAGAFFAGLALSSFPVNGVARGLLGSFATFFNALFFTALGSLLTIPETATLTRGMLLAGMVIVVTPPVVAIIAEWRGMTSRQAIESGLLLAQSSEFALILALSGLVFGAIDAGVFSVVAFVTVVTMTLTPAIANERVTEWLLRLHPLRRRVPLPSRERAGHVLLLGFGGAGMWVVKPLIEAGHEVLVVDDDPTIIGELDRAKIPCMRGDGSDERVLEAACAGAAKLVIASMRRVGSAARVLKHVHGVPVVVRVFEERDAEAVTRLGGIPILNSEAAADSFMEWFAKAGPHREEA